MPWMKKSHAFQLNIDMRPSWHLYSAIAWQKELFDDEGVYKDNLIDSE